MCVVCVMGEVMLYTSEVNAPFSTSRIRGHNNAFFPLWYIVLDPFKDCWFSIQVVYWNIEKALGVINIV